MKKLLFAIAAVATAAVSFALANDDETMVITRNNGKIHAIHTNEIEKVTVSEYELAEKFYDLSADTLLVHDTINNYVELHDTTIIVETEQIHDSIFLTDTLYITEFVHDTIYVASGTGNGIHEGHEYVDLGLPSRLMWATCNIGAIYSEEYGAYIAWGETQNKSEYSWSTYQWCNGKMNTITKYCTTESVGIVDNITELELVDDIADVRWGGLWRMPTQEDWDELINNCICAESYENGIKGIRVTGFNGKSIFLPASGYKHGSNNGNIGSFGYYWSSSLYYNSNYAYGVLFSVGNVGMREFERCCGLSVRPVCKINE